MGDRFLDITAQTADHVRSAGVVDGDAGATPVVKRLKDMGDGTFAELVAVAESGTPAATSTFANASGQAVSGACRLKGFSVLESAGTVADPAAKVYLRDGTDATGTKKAIITLATNESDRDWFGDEGIAFATGIYVDVAVGAVEITVWSSAA